MWALTACEALRAGKRLNVIYDVYSCVVETHAVGTSKNGRIIARVWQVRGGSTGSEPAGWKLLRLDEARVIELLDEVSAAPRPGYEREDKDIVRIHCQI